MQFLFNLTVSLLNTNIPRKRRMSGTGSGPGANVNNLRWKSTWFDGASKIIRFIGPKSLNSRQRSLFYADWHRQRMVISVSLIFKFRRIRKIDSIID